MALFGLGLFTPEDKCEWALNDVVCSVLCMQPFYQMYWKWVYKGRMFSVFWESSSVFPGADFRGAVRFGVVTNKQVAEAIPLQDDETVYLYRRLNSSLVSKSQQVMKV